jgi:hypothetical protein
MMRFRTGLDPALVAVSRVVAHDRKLQHRKNVARLSAANKDDEAAVAALKKEIGKEAFDSASGSVDGFDTHRKNVARVSAA